MIKDYIILILVFVLIGFGIIVSIKCSKLEKEVLKLKMEQFSIVDSIKTENNLLNKEILLLSDDLEYYKFKVDSLKSVKQKVVVETKYVVSEDLIEGVQTLKDHLKCEKY